MECTPSQAVKALNMPAAKNVLENLGTKSSLGRAWTETASNLIAEHRRARRAIRTQEAERQETNAADDDEGIVRSMGLARMVDTFGKALELPYQVENSKWSKVFGPAVDMHEVMVRRLITDGFSVEIAGTIADMAGAQRKARFRENGKCKRGRYALGPRLFEKKRKCADGTTKRFVYIKHFETRKSAEIELQDGETLKLHMGAHYALAEFVEEKVREALNYTLVRDVTMKRIYDEFLDEHQPGSNPEALDADNYKRAKAALNKIVGYNGTFALDRIGINAAIQYSNHRTAQEKERQSSNAEETEYVSSATARIEVDYMIMAVNWFCLKYNLPPKLIIRPKVRGTGYKYIPFAHVLRLLRACRGRKFDSRGRLVGTHDLAARYACVERFIWLYLYSGTRHGNLPELLWHWDEKAGHISMSAGRIVRQGQWAEVTRKRRGQSTFNGSLAELLPRWEAEDNEKRRDKKSNVLYCNVLHDENGGALADSRIGVLFREVRALAGLQRVTPHMLKHAGVTMCTHAGMDRNAISYAYSTHSDTLERYYTHLNEEWDTPRKLDPKDLLFFRLHRFSERPLRVDHAA